MQQSNYLRVKNLSFSIGNKLLVDNVSFEIPFRKKTALVGLNGAGKSSLIRLLIGQYKAARGSVSFSNISPSELLFNDQLGYQDSAMQALPNITGYEYLHLCCELKARLKSNIEQQIKQVIRLWGVSQPEQLMPRLSEGNLQKLFIAQAFLGCPDYIILDEPTQTLDPIEQQRFVENLALLDNFNICLFSSHHINEAVQIADYVLLLHHGKLVARLDLSNKNEYWLMSELSNDDVKKLLRAEEVITYHSKQGKFLYAIKSLTVDTLNEIDSLLACSHVQSVFLGEAKAALMPLFSLLANDDL